MTKQAINSYPLLSKLAHWLSAITIIGLFALGFWMVDLTYYSSWYKTAPHWHKSIGVLLLLATAIRLIYKLKQPKVLPIVSHSKLVKKASALTHVMLYLMMIILMISGYLISTADGRAIEVFNWFSVASVGELFANQEDIAGLVHKYLAYSLITLVVVHAGAAIKHHVIDKDDTLKRMTSK
ncbi:cytochrome b [Thalassotalea psychrophila]|uniref:Cytochrome b n=1 Tax=Thalassotalea psychrophila TaxID=3065647 RepID=A0ABY9U0D5_9GAMM|nr:cytochrome b [Colwelliaceae bacterium SQ149]